MPTRGRNLVSALLSDWPDSQVEETAADLEVLDYARREVANLSARYAYDGKTRFYPPQPPPPYNCRRRMDRLSAARCCTS